jgi:hypothetical protein
MCLPGAVVLMSRKHDSVLVLSDSEEVTIPLFDTNYFMWNNKIHSTLRDWEVIFDTYQDYIEWSGGCVCVEDELEEELIGRLDYKYLGAYGL